MAKLKNEINFWVAESPTIKWILQASILLFNDLVGVFVLLQDYTGLYAKFFHNCGVHYSALAFNYSELCFWLQDGTHDSCKRKIWNEAVIICSKKFKKGVLSIMLLFSDISLNCFSMLCRFWMVSYLCT